MLLKAPPVLNRSENYLVVIIPALNEEATIAQVVGAVPRHLNGVACIHVLVIDDGSTDRTAELAVAAGAFCYRKAQNQGLGSAVSVGIKLALRAGADYIVNMDGDGQFNPNDIPSLVHPLLNGPFGFATCTRFANPELRPTMPWIKEVGNAWVCRLVSKVTGRSFSDVSCGFRAYTRETALKLTIWSNFTYTQESFISLVNLGIPICEVPLRVRGVRQFGESRIASNLWRFGRQILLIILRAMRDTRPLTFFGILALILASLGGMQFLVVAANWLLTGKTSPWKSLLITGTLFMSLSGFTAVIALLADQVGRIRSSLEEVVYFERLSYYRDNRLQLSDLASSPQ